MGRLICVAFVLLSAVLLPDPVLGQQGGATIGAQQDRGNGFTLGQNYPNPFSTETRIPFELHEEVFPEGRPAVVSIRIFNILRQYVASPTALGHPAGDGTEVVDLEYTAPGRYEAYWDGLDRSGVPVARGNYVYELIVNGRGTVLMLRVN